MTKPKTATKRYRVVRAIAFRPSPEAPEMTLQPGQVYPASGLPPAVLGELASGALEEVS